ncbi:response regulator, partial [Desulfovibrio sp. A2]
FFARCIAVADAYDAMTTDRPYRKALTSQEARAELLRLRNVQWDAAIVDAFLIILDGDVEREEAS